MLSLMEAAAYRRIADDVIRALPPAFRAYMKNVVVIIEERPQRGRRTRLLGLYEGVPVTEWGKGMGHVELPDQITLFTRAIEASVGSDDEVPHVVRETMWHEIAHHFGFDHGAIDEMERRWRAKRDE